MIMAHRVAQNSTSDVTQLSGESEPSNYSRIITFCCGGIFVIVVSRSNQQLHAFYSVEQYQVSSTSFTAVSTVSLSYARFFYSFYLLFTNKVA